MKAKSSSLQRRVQCYPPPGLYNSIVHYAKERRISSSQAAVYMIQRFFDDQPPPPTPAVERGAHDDNTQQTSL